MLNNTALRVPGRLAAILITPIAFSVAVAAAGWAPVTLDIIDAMLISFSIGSVVLFWPRMLLTLRSPDPFRAVDYITFALYDLFFYAFLAGIWSVRARSNHSIAIYGSDIEIRIAFRFLAVRCIVYIMVAQGFDEEHVRPSVAKWLRAIAVGIIAVTALACIDILRSRSDASSRVSTQQDWSLGVKHGYVDE